MAVGAFIRGFCDRAVLKVVLVQLANAMLLGYIIGYVGVYNTLVSINEDCTSLKTQEACDSVKFTECAWSSNNTCFFKDIDCGLFNEDECRSHEDKCAFDNDDKVCKHLTGFAATPSGIFAGAMTVGGMIGSMVAGYVVNKIGRKKALILSASICLISSVLVHISRGVDAYGLLVAARVILGIGTGLSCVASPMYTEEMTPEPYRKPVGTMFQVFCTLGIALAATVGLIVEPHDFAASQNNEVRIQMFIGVQTFLCLFALVVGIMVPESTRWLAMQDGGNKETGSIASGSELVNDSAPLIHNTVHYSWGSMLFPLGIATIMCLAQQMTGINAIMNFAPTITKSMGFSAMMGNWVVMLWNFVTTLISIPAASKFSMRQMFVTGTLIASCATFVTGIPIFPGVYGNEEGRHALAGLGIFLFILAFEVGMGPAFYVLAQELFPSSFRPKGSSYTLATQFVFNIIINVCFPIAVVDLSGGPSGNQDKGLAIVFFFFGTCGMLAFALLFKFLHPFKEALIAGESA